MSFEDLDSGTSKNIGDSLKDAYRAPETFAAQTLEGTGQVGSLLNDSNSFNRSAAFGNDDISGAINRKTKQSYVANNRELQTMANYDALNQKMERLKTSSQLAMQEHQYNQQARMLRYQERQRKKAMRGALLGQVLGIAGAIGGGLGFGAAGAVAGNMIGQGLGQTVGGV